MIIHFPATLFTVLGKAVVSIVKILVKLLPSG